MQAKSEQQTWGQIEPRGSQDITGKGNNDSHPRVPPAPVVEPTFQCCLVVDRTPALAATTGKSQFNALQLWLGLHCLGSGIQKSADRFDCAVLEEIDDRQRAGIRFLQQAKGANDLE